MTQAGYDLLINVLELYKICFQTVILFSLWRIVFRTKKEKSAIIAAILFAILSIATGLLFTTPLIRYTASIIFAVGYCFIRYRKYYEKAIFTLLLYHNFHSLSYLVSISLYQKLQSIMTAGLDIMQSDYLYQTTMKIAISGVIMNITYTLIMIFMVFVT